MIRASNNRDRIKDQAFLSSVHGVPDSDFFDAFGKSADLTLTFDAIDDVKAIQVDA